MIRILYYLGFNKIAILKKSTLLLTFLLLYFFVSAVGTEGNINDISPNSKVVKEGLFEKLRNRVIEKKIKKLTSKLNQDSCDVILVYSDENVLARIVEIQDKKIFFTTCDEPNGTIDSLTCYDVNILFLADGSQYKCGHRSYPRRSNKANFIKSSGNSLVQANQECDILVLMNKDQLAVEITEIKDDYLYFKSCSDNSAAVDSFAMNEIRTYRKKNGYAKRVNQYAYETRNSSSGDALTRGLLGLLKGLLIAALVIVLLILFLFVSIS